MKVIREVCQLTECDGVMVMRDEKGGVGRCDSCQEV